MIQTLVEHVTKLEKTIVNLQKRNSDLEKREDYLENELASRTQRLDAAVASLTEQMAMLSSEQHHTPSTSIDQCA